MTGIEPVVTEVGRFTVSCHTITAASPLLAPQGGIEPPTNGLTVRYSAAELLGNNMVSSERIELSSHGPKPRILPLN